MQVEAESSRSREEAIAAWNTRSASGFEEGVRACEAAIKALELQLWKVSEGAHNEENYADASRYQTYSQGMKLALVELAKLFPPDGGKS